MTSQFRVMASFFYFINFCNSKNDFTKIHFRVTNSILGKTNSTFRVSNSRFSPESWLDFFSLIGLISENIEPSDIENDYVMEERKLLANGNPFDIVLKLKSMLSVVSFYIIESKKFRCAIEKNQCAVYAQCIVTCSIRTNHYSRSYTERKNISMSPGSLFASIEIYHSGKVLGTRATRDWEKLNSVFELD